MPPVNIDLDRLSRDELVALVQEACKRLLFDQQTAFPLPIHDDQNRTIGHVIPGGELPEFDETEEEFLAEVERRIANPPDRFLTPEEFFAALDEPSGTAIPSPTQLDAANGDGQRVP